MRAIKTVSNQSISIRNPILQTKSKMGTLILLAVLSWGLLTECNISAAKTIYVDDDAPVSSVEDRNGGANDGTSWADAYVFLQDALADANSAEKPVEIRVACGTYKPDKGAGQIPGDREATFKLINGVTLAGGYAGLNVPDPNTDPNARDFVLYETILSGNIKNDDRKYDNSYHVVTGSGTDNFAVLDGFTVTSGNDDRMEFDFESIPMLNPIGYGAGLYNSAGSPIVSNCSFRDHRASASGSGMYNEDNSSSILIGCTFFDNYNAGMFNGESEPNLINCLFENNQHGGMVNRQSSPTLLNCIFINNSAFGGGGMHNFNDSNPTLTHCTFEGNSAAIGGGILNRGSDPNLIYCFFIRNWANRENGYGGGIYNTDSDVILTNCTFDQNAAQSGNSIACDSSAEYFPSNVEFVNCIVWGGANEIWNNDGSLINIAYCNIQSGQAGVYDPCEAVIWGEGNIDEDPLFADPGYWADVNDPDIITEPNDPNVVWIDGDYHLKSKAGRYDPNSESWVADDVTSPCIDAGDPNMPVGDEPFPNGGRINMGAYGGTREASMSQETGGMSLPDIAYIYLDKHDTAESFRSLLESYGCPTTLIKTKNVTATLLESCDLVIVADDTFYIHAWTDFNGINAIEDSGKPIVGLGDGGYDFFGRLGLSIGSPHGLGNNHNSIYVIDPAYSLFSTPYLIDIPQDGILQLYTESRVVALYFWPDIPETATVLAVLHNEPGYYPLAIEHNRYFLWGFEESPEKMTDIGKKLFVNTVIWTANAGWESEN